MTMYGMGSLLQLHHWAFDMGLISLNETYQVVVSQLTEEQGPMEWMLTELRDNPYCCRNAINFVLLKMRWIGTARKCSDGNL